MWRYQQASGHLTQNDIFIAVGYSGNGSGLNNPDADREQGIGPIPKGRYKIGAPYQDAEKGPCVMPLIADDPAQLHGRSGFLCHGDNREMNHTASHGCLILDREPREKMAASQDRDLEVIA